MTLFGDGDNLTAHYRLAADVDATPTRRWNSGNGFTPLGGVFVGSLDGEGREIRGLYANLKKVDGGLFHTIGDGGRVSRLGLPDVEIRGTRVVSRIGIAAVAHFLSGNVSLVWATGDIIADDDFTFASGLVRIATAGSQIRESWFVGKVRGRDDTGGLVGNGLGGEVRDSWAVARVEWSGAGDGNIGGLVGNSSDGFALNQSWSGGWLDTDANERALIGGGAVVADNYFDRSISRASVAVHGAVLAVDTIVTVTNMAWSTMAWNFGDITLSDDNAADYPFLRGIEDLWPGLQAVAFANFQTRILSVAGGVELPSEGRTVLGIEESINLDFGHKRFGDRRFPDADMRRRRRRDGGENELQRCDGAIADDRRWFGGVYGRLQDCDSLFGQRQHFARQFFAGCVDCLERSDDIEMVAFVRFAGESDIFG